MTYFILGYFASAAILGISYNRTFEFLADALGIICLFGILYALLMVTA